MTVRYTKRAIKAAVSAARQSGNPVVSVNLEIMGKSVDPRWTASVGVVDAQAGTQSDYKVADDSGKVRYFPTIDAVVKFMAEVDEDGNGDYSIGGIATGALYASKVPADIYKDAENKVVKLTKASADQTDKRAAIESLVGSGGAMNGWNSGNAAQRARYQEAMDQLSSLTGDIASIGAEIARLNAVIASKP